MFDRGLNTSLYICTLILARITLREKCPYSEFFWSVSARTWTEYEEIYLLVAVIYFMLSTNKHIKIFMYVC